MNNTNELWVAVNPDNVFKAFVHCPCRTLTGHWIDVQADVYRCGIPIDRLYLNYISLAGRTNADAPVRISV